MIGGPDSYGAGGYQKTPLEETLPVDMGVRDRQKQPDVALVVVIDQSGSMDACHCNSFNGGAGRRHRYRWRPQGRHRQGGDPARRGRTDRARRARRRVVQRAGALGRPRPSRWVASTTCRARSPGIQPLGQTNIFAGLEQAVESLEDATATRRHIILLTDGWSSSGQYDDDPRADEGGRDHALDGRRRRWLEPVPAGPRAAGRRPLLRRGEPGQHPRHLPQGDPAGLRPADHRGAVLPDPDLVVADPARPRRGPAAAARLQRHDRQAGGPDRARHGPRRPAPRPVAVRAGPVGRVDVRLDRPLGARLARLGAASRASSASSCRGRSRARRPAASRPRSTRSGGQTTLHVESVEADGSPRDFYSTTAVVVGPDFTPADVDARPDRPGRVRGRRSARSIRARTASAITQTRPGSTPLGRTVGLVAPTAAEYRLLGHERAVPGVAAHGDRRRRDRDARSTRGSTTCGPRPARPTCGRSCCVLALLLWPLDIALRRVSVGRREFAAAGAWVRALPRRGARPRPGPRPARACSRRAPRASSERDALRPAPHARRGRRAAPTATATSPAPATPRRGADRSHRHRRRPPPPHRLRRHRPPRHHQPTPAAPAPAPADAGRRHAGPSARRQAPGPRALAGERHPGPSVSGAPGRRPVAAPRSPASTHRPATPVDHAVASTPPPRSCPPRPARGRRRRRAASAPR